MRPTPPFLTMLASRGDEPLLRGVRGTIRFDLRGGDAVEGWTVAIDDGRVEIVRRRRADCLATMDSDLFGAIASGEKNAFSAALRGEIEVSGDPALLLAFQRVFPGPPGDRRPSAGNDAGTTAAAEVRAGAS